MSRVFFFILFPSVVPSFGRLLVCFGPCVLILGLDLWPHFLCPATVFFFFRTLLFTQCIRDRLSFPPFCQLKLLVLLFDYFKSLERFNKD